MKHLDRPQTNTRVYWNDTYGNPVKAQEYKAVSQRFDQAITYVKDGDRFIDLGCGVGTLGRMIRSNRKDCEIWGVDISDIVIAQNCKDDPKGKFYQGYIGSLNFLPQNYFDIVFSGEVIEHLDDPNDLFRDAYRVLKKGGMLIVTTPVENKIDSDEHMWSFTKKDVQELYESAGFHDVTFDDLPDLEYTLIIFGRAIK